MSFIPILAQINPYVTPQNSITQWLANMIPLSTIASVVNSIMLPFVCLGVMLVVIGTMMSVGRAEGGSGALGAYVRATILIAGMASCIWWLQMAQGLANGMVSAIGTASPQIQALSVLDPTTGAETLNPGQIFQKISQFLVGNTNPAAANPGLNIGAWSDYLMRLVLILLISLVAGVTTFIMDAMILIQKLILLLSRPFVPVFLGCLALEATKSNAYNFFKQVLGVMAWPIGWALVNVGTVAALQNLQPPNWLGDLGGLIMSLTILTVVCLWMIVGTIGAPKFISWSLTTGGNFAAGMVGMVSSTGMQMTADSVAGVSKVGGAAIGGQFGGEFGAKLGAFLGGGAGGMTASLGGGMAQSIEGGTGGGSIAPSAKSAAAADAAVALIVDDEKEKKEARRA